MTLKQYIKFLKTQPQDVLVPIGKVAKYLSLLDPPPQPITGKKIEYDGKAGTHPLAGKILRLRAQGKTQAEVGEAVGLSKSYVQRIERCAKELKEKQ